MDTRSRTFTRAAWLVLGYAILVIVWGAVVRATSSGAGCGAHWPLCNGEVVPLAPGTATIIEFAHRATSGLILLFTVALMALAYRTYPQGHPARGASVWALVFVVIEAAVGAGIVLLQLVEGNASALRAGYIAVHLANTMLLVGAYTRCVFVAVPRPTAWTATLARTLEPWTRVGLVALIAVSAAGAVVALGDTLFPQTSLAAGLAADFDPAAHLLVRLRMWHPILAVMTAAYLTVLVTTGGLLRDHGLRRPAWLSLGLLAAQLVLGVTNLLALAPLWLQMAHLLVSNVLWGAWVWLWLLQRQACAADGRA